MRRFVFVTVLLSVALTAASVRAADTYEIDPAHSSIGFSISHLVISKVKGKFNEFTATLAYDAEAKALKEAGATIKTASIETGIQKRDDHLRSADFFDAEKYPEIAFKTKSIAKKDGQWVATGTLTLHGVSKEIALPFKLNGPIKDPWGSTRVGIEARLTIDRKDYGLTWNKALETGGVLVGDEVEIDIQAEFIKAEKK
jgi:polyisoprenoid-binding protein YceI